MKKPLSASQLSQAAESVIIALACAGDVPAYAEIVKRYQIRIRNFMRRLCNHPDLADDLAQQVFLKAWRSIQQLRSPAAFSGWLKKVMVSVWLEDMRRNKLDFVDWDESESQVSYNGSPGKRIDLDSALARLPATVRLCIVLAYNDGLSHQEISDVTDLPLGTVKSNISRGAAKMRAMLSDYRKTG